MEWSHSHGENGSHCVQRGNDDADLTDASSEEQGPGGLSVGLAVAKHLPHNNKVVTAGTG